MCFVIAVSVERSAVGPLEATLNTSLPKAPRHVADRFGDGQEVRMLYGGGCCCRLYRETLDAADLQVLRRKYGKRGWNNDRIERVLGEQRRLGGLDGRALEYIAGAAQAVGPMSVAVYWDLGEESELAMGESVSVAEFRVRRPSLASGRIVRLTP